MEPALIVTHLDDRHTGLVRDSLQGAGLEVVEWNPLDDAPAPSVSDISGIVSLGGRMSATEVDRHPFLAAEVELLRDALATRLPVLGMCLGAQLLAVAASGRVSRMERMYVGWPELSLLPVVAEDPVFGGLPADLPVLKWHEDMIDVPADSVLLGIAGPGAALFRIGAAAWGSQMHLELTPPMLLGWLAERGGIAEIEAAGYDIDAFRAESRRRLAAQMTAAQPVFSRFARLVLTPATIATAPPPARADGVPAGTQSPAGR
jgi:GMP synthase-like glutamine amidotransferase